MQLKRELREVIEANGLARQEVADLLHVSLATVHGWLRPVTSKASAPPPRMAIELLAIKAKAREKAA